MEEQAEIKLQIDRLIRRMNILELRLNELRDEMFDDIASLRGKYALMKREESKKEREKGVSMTMTVEEVEEFNTLQSDAEKLAWLKRKGYYVPSL